MVYSPKDLCVDIFAYVNAPCYTEGIGGSDMNTTADTRVCHCCPEQIPDATMDAKRSDPYWPIGHRINFRDPRIKINPMQCQADNQRCSKCCPHNQCHYARHDYEGMEGQQ